MDQPARPAAVGLAHSTAMGLVSDSLADRQGERVPDGPLEFPVVIASLAGVPVSASRISLAVPICAAALS
jgi:hypothetical protein